MIFNFTYKNTFIYKDVPSVIRFTNKTNELIKEANSMFLSKYDCIINFDKKATNHFKENSEDMEKILKRVTIAVDIMKNTKYKYIEFDEDHEDLINITKHNDGSLQVIDKDDNVLNILYIQQEK